MLDRGQDKQSISQAFFSMCISLQCLFSTVIMKLLLLRIMIVTPSLVLGHREPGYEAKLKPYKVVCFYTYPENKLHVISTSMFRLHWSYRATSYQLQTEQSKLPCVFKILISYYIGMSFSGNPPTMFLQCMLQNSAINSQGCRLGAVTLAAS